MVIVELYIKLQILNIMVWFKRKNQGIFTDSKSKKNVPEGLWFKCPSCKQLIPKEEHEKNHSVCSHCDYHSRINSKQYFSIIFDNNKYVEINKMKYNITFIYFNYIFLIHLIIT